MVKALHESDIGADVELRLELGAKLKQDLLLFDEAELSSLQQLAVIAIRFLILRSCLVLGSRGMVSCRIWPAIGLARGRSSLLRIGFAADIDRVEIVRLAHVSAELVVCLVLQLELDEVALVVAWDGQAEIEVPKRV